MVAQKYREVPNSIIPVGVLPLVPGTMSATTAGEEPVRLHSSAPNAELVAWKYSVEPHTVKLEGNDDAPPLMEPMIANVVPVPQYRLVKEPTVPDAHTWPWNTVRWSKLPAKVAPNAVDV